ncbi:TonB-dependent receptor [Aliiglaciecola sp. LCG003]|uniref:TonB-dependent receptor n=1 Tax=Aliiglaciecola sp. LCG003 TaxID=3053655 RepID=UPI00257300A1|nr:TonB-dependent receptor [Aliiglaciecola sp. LCG003]WJG10129.1 TonB-dependent receptor [Aliiglaciecola sp. LCG003]
MKHMTFNKKYIAASISLLLGSSILSPAFAQEEAEAATATDDIETIQVKGIRGSLARAMDIKRNAKGIVDAISAEEMGKFPDTNLAESLQRITGVTISRKNGEGSQITIRGFGPDKNLVTLNGRQMPGTGNTRSYDLENLSSDGVSALEVYKTGVSHVPTGGLGGTVNIVTAKPLASPGLKYVISGKGIYDQSNVEGDDVTPELSALYSDTFADNTFGVAVSVSLQERDFQQQSANVPGWQADQGPFGSATSFVDLRPDAASEDDDIKDGATADGKTGHTYFPRQISYNINNVERSRLNSQLTLQYAPKDNMTFTLDYVYSEAETATSGLGFGVWFNFGGNVNSYELDERGTAIRFTESNNDFAHSANVETLLVESDSIGFNFEWQATDEIHVELDYHDSKTTTDNGADDGLGHSGNVILAPNNIVTKTYDFSQGGVPQFDMVWPNGASEASPADFDPLFAQFNRSEGESSIEQIQLDAEWINPNDSFLTSVRFGLANTEQTFGGYSADNGNVGPNGYNGNEAIFPDSMFTRNNTGDFLDEFSNGGGNLVTDYYYSFDYAEAIARMESYFGFSTDPLDPNFGTLSEGYVTEKTQSVYLSGDMFFEIADMPLDINLGIRYEKTDVNSDVRQNVEDFLVWSNPTEWQLRYKEGGDGFLNTTGEHDVTLPNLNIKLEVTEDIVARFSVGKTIARAPLGNLLGGRSLSGSPKPGNRTGGSGNTNLLPFESFNVDLSAEYYYDDASYISIGYFRKDVKNFISTSFNTITVDGLRDPFIGPRAIQAEADVVARGDQPTVTAIWEQIIANGGGVDDSCCETQIVKQNDSDPLVEWLVSQPANGEDKTVDGIEFAVQHMFGDSGFGAGFNVTLVDGDVKYDTENFSVQSPLTGLGDSANLQVFYEKDGLSAKLSYAWRDDYLLGVGQAQGSAEAPPQFFKEFAQTDLSINYDVNDNLTVFFEGLNLFNETEEIYGRYEEQFLAARQYGTRYNLGARYSF